jgi:hypothetical protein
VAAPAPPVSTGTWLGDVLIVGVIVVVVVLLAIGVWRRGGPHSETPPEKQ